jgi:hypothetical protein
VAVGAVLEHHAHLHNHHSSRIVFRRNHFAARRSTQQSLLVLREKKKKKKKKSEKNHFSFFRRFAVSSSPFATTRRLRPGSRGPSSRPFSAARTWARRRRPRRGRRRVHSTFKQINLVLSLSLSLTQTQTQHIVNQPENKSKLHRTIRNEIMISSSSSSMVVVASILNVMAMATQTRAAPLNPVAAETTRWAPNSATPMLWLALLCGVVSLLALLLLLLACCVGKQPAQQQQQQQQQPVQQQPEVVVPPQPTVSGKEKERKKKKGKKEFFLFFLFFSPSLTSRCISGSSRSTQEQVARHDGDFQSL